MQAVYRRRLADRILMVPTWERVCKETSYDLGSLRATFSEHENVRNFAAILYRGLWLQRAVAEKRKFAQSVAAELATELAEYAVLSVTPYEDSQRERVGAAFLLWPFHSARYYGYSKATEAERNESRKALCNIQAILYNNVRTLLDILRLWFDRYDDAHLNECLTEPETEPTQTKPTQTKPIKTDGAKPERVKRSDWRHAKLTQNTPDLCAVDFLVQHLLEIMKARPLVRKAIESVQKISLNSDLERSEKVRNAVEKACADVTAAFKALRLAQMTVFYNPDPSRIGTAEIPLTELVHGTFEDPIPAMLIPFDGEPEIAKNFRQLASNIYSDSARRRQSYPSFFEHRTTVINLLKAEADATSGLVEGVTRFISDGQTTSSFLSSEPPKPKTCADASANCKRTSRENKRWPIWYSSTLDKIQLSGEFPDWSDWDFWWRPVDSKELGRLLFPGGDGESNLHDNHHKSAYWDELAKHGTLSRSIKIPRRRPTSEPKFGHLMELLLRRESETRTSFFFALAQTYEENNARLCHFVGGTFLGLERPGIPFSEERFKAIAARIRGLVMAVAHYTATHAVKTERKIASLERNDFGRRLNKILRLLRGKDGDYNRDGDLLFASRAHQGKGASDHALSEWRPSRQQIRRIFHEAEHLRPNTDQTLMPARCDRTWKGLFYLGGDQQLHFTLRKFLGDLEEALGGDVAGMAHRDIECKECFNVALKFLIGDAAARFANNILLTTPFSLPSRPGIRFLLVACRFISHVQEEATEGNASITGIEFARGLFKLKFSNPNLIDNLERFGNQRARFSHTVGRFQSIKTQAVFSEQDERPGWNSFLNSPRFAAPLQVEMDAADHEIRVRWDE